MIKGFVGNLLFDLSIFLVELHCRHFSPFVPAEDIDPETKVHYLGFPT